MELVAGRAMNGQVHSREIARLAIVDRERCREGCSLDSALRSQNQYLAPPSPPPHRLYKYVSNLIQTDEKYGLISVYGLAWETIRSV
jgi:hypothetical protein